MSALLASVTGLREARIALDAGADIIDLKDPKTGALGALPLRVIESIVRLVDGRRPCSATVGDLPAVPEILNDAVAKVARTGVDFVKVGFFDDTRLDACLEALGSHTQRAIRIVAVLFADRHPDLEILDSLAACGFAGVMLDTANKAGGGLCRHISQRRLEAFVRRAKRRGLLAGLAGSLGIHDIPALLPLEPDYLGFRTALCDRRQRTAELDKNAIRSVRICMSKYSVHRSSVALP